MFALLNPTALLALLGLLVPVAIHLWNRRPGREVAVGSLRWLAAGANRRLRNLQLEQLGLLLLRAALLAVLAVAVAGPVWRTALPTSRGVVLLSAEAAGLPALASLKPTIDLLRRKGYALRWLAADFPRVPGGVWRTLGSQPEATADSLAASAIAQPSNQAFAWARVQQAAAAFPGQPLFVVTGAALRNFGGTHPPLPAAVRWQTLPDSATTAWLGAAELVGDSIQLLVGRSNEARTTYRRRKVLRKLNGQPLPVPGLAPAQVSFNQRAGVLLSAGKNSRAVDTISIDRLPTVIEIYAASAYTADARFLEAGLRAASAGLAVAPQLRRTKTRPQHLQADWTFWLSDESLPATWREEVARNGRQLWCEAAAPGVADTAHFATAEAGAGPVTVLRRDAHLPAPGVETVWADGRGRAILSRQRLGRGKAWQLHTRLNPTWSTLADDPQLPTRLLQLLQPEPGDDANNPPAPLAAREAAHDRRALAAAQLSAAPATAGLPAAGSAQPRAFRTTELRPWLVLLAGLLLLLERLLARRRDILTLAPTT